MSEVESVDVTDAPAVESAEQTVKPESESASQESQPDAAESEAKSKGSDSVQKRIDKVTRDKWDAIQARQAAESRAQELEQRLQQFQQSKSQPTDSGPKQDDYQDWDSYQRAIVDHAAAQHVERALTAQRQAESQRTLREQQQSNVREFVVRAENLSNELPDFNQAMSSVQIQADGPIGAAILQSEQGAAVAYFLGSNPAELLRLESIRDPVRAAIEIGRLEAKAATFVQSRSKSRAPAQAKPLSSGGRAQGSGFSASDSMDEFARKWRERK